MELNKEKITNREFTKNDNQLKLFNSVLMLREIQDKPVTKKDTKFIISPTYISLFSGAGIGCYGFQQEGFICLASVEILKKRLEIQKYNNKCLYPSGYICGNLENESVKTKIFENINYYSKHKNNFDLDLIVATPPCQGMSVANHKKNQEDKKRNSLVVESIKIVNEIKPKFFIFENVKSFWKTLCTDKEGNDKPIGEVILDNLAGEYNILNKVLNFKNYGSNSSRTRTLVIGVRKDIENVCPYDLLPSYKKEKNLKEVIGKLPSLKQMGIISEKDIYHSFREYDYRMFEWIKDLKEGQSAFDNQDPLKKPHLVVDGRIVENKNKNSDKYKRQEWLKVAPCIHTRNDILASQNTVHPSDPRVFSIRELMLLMGIPNQFNWSEKSSKELNKLDTKSKKLYLKEVDLNIRHSIGEAVPTPVFRSIAIKINESLLIKQTTDKELFKLIDELQLDNPNNLINFLKISTLDFRLLVKICELSNTRKYTNAAYYTRQDISFSVVNELPDFSNRSYVRILEPSVGAGAFLPLLFKKYEHIDCVELDLIDKDHDSIRILKQLLKKTKIPRNFRIKFYVYDYLKFKSQKKYDLIIGNPPFGCISTEDELKAYKQLMINQQTKNIFSFFIEKSLQDTDYLSFIVPKSLLSTPEFNQTRYLLSELSFEKITDYGESAFRGVKIETISFIVQTKKKENKPLQEIIIESYITKKRDTKPQEYVFDPKLPYWIIYRDSEFDRVLYTLNCGLFKVFRDRQITKKLTSKEGKVRVLKSRNIDDNKIIDIPGYDTYIDDYSGLSVAKYLNQSNIVLVPNLTYNPRACFLPENCITDGSLAILTPLKKLTFKLRKNHLKYYSSDEFRKFYMKSRNFGTRSLNIDSNSVFFFGIKK
jgi:DNA (cytosine-5)-methyltransferase 1